MPADPAIRHGVYLRLEFQRCELGGDAVTPLERLLVERILICYLEVQVCDARLVATPYRREDQDFLTALEDRRDRAHRRYLSAVKALATTRKLLGVRSADPKPMLSSCAPSAPASIP
jgi:hypothetical protein